MAFPTLYPFGQADFNESRLRKVDLKDYARHMMCYQDGRFGRHPRWRFLIFNMLLRQRASKTATFLVSKSSGLKDLSREELTEALQADNSLLRHIVRSGAAIPGTRPYWRKQGYHLHTYARFLSDISPVFVTLSCADMQWDDLQRHQPRYTEYSNSSDAIRLKIVWDNVQNYPHVIAHYPEIRLQAFMRLVVKPLLGYTDYWHRYEWQARGSGHIHCLLWVIRSPKMDQSTSDLRDIFASFWGEYITAWNPNPERLPDRRNPASIPPNDIVNTADQFASLANRLQMHPICSAPYCLRRRKGAEQLTCRFHYPRALTDVPIVTKAINNQSWLFSPARNQPNLNQCTPVITMGWMANTDIQPSTSLHAVLNYLGKYVSKAEKASTSYIELQAQILPYINSRSPLLSFASKLLNKLIAERDWSGQEVSHILLGLPLQEGSRSVINLDCRPEIQNDLIAVDGDDLTAQKSPLQRYIGRPNV